MSTTQPTTEIEIGTGAPTALYRLFAASGQLLYVGVSSDPGKRFGQHAADKPWWSDVARWSAGWYPSRQEALAAEAAVIAAECPALNIRQPLPPVISSGPDTSVADSGTSTIAQVVAHAVQAGIAQGLAQVAAASTAVARSEAAFCSAIKAALAYELPEDPAGAA